MKVKSLARPKAGRKASRASTYSQGPLESTTSSHFIFSLGGRLVVSLIRQPILHAQYLCRGAGGGSRTHFSHHCGCLLRVATRRVCSPSPEPIGPRWTSQPRPRMAPGEDDEPAANRISLMKRPTNSLGSTETVNRIQRLSRPSPQSFIGRSRRDSKIS